jgi:hypothetical protein
MKSFFKRIIIVISVIIVVVVFAFLFFVKSDYYLNKQAFSKRAEKLNELNSIKRLFVYEGIYIYHHTSMVSNYETDKLSNQIGQERSGDTDIEFSFTSKKLIIQNRLQDIKEEIIFKNEYEISSIEENACAYKFFIDKWNLRHISTNDLIKDISSMQEYDKFITLFVEKGIPSSFHSYYGFRSTAYNKNKPNQINLLLKGVGGDPNLVFNVLKQKYNDVYAPEYVDLATYKDNIYKLETYKNK